MLPHFLIASYIFCPHPPLYLPTTTLALGEGHEGRGWLQAAPHLRRDRARQILQENATLTLDGALYPQGIGEALTSEHVCMKSASSSEKLVRIICSSTCVRIATVQQPMGASNTDVLTTTRCFSSVSELLVSSG